MTLLDRLLLRQADIGYLGIGEYHRGDGLRGILDVVACDRFGRHYGLLAGLVRQDRLARHVTYGVDAGHRRPALWIDRDESTLVGPQTGGRELE